MILDKNSCLEVLINKNELILSEVEKYNKTDAGLDELSEIINTASKKKYIFSKTVIETLDTIKIKDEFDCNILKERKTSNGIILLNESELYIFQEINQKLRVLNFVVSVKKDYTDFNFFTFNLEENKTIVDNHIGSDVWKQFLQCIIYLDFLETEIKYINPKETTGTKKTDKIVNKTDNTFILVTKAWNQSYKTRPNIKFYSKPHWGIRWTGTGRATPKMVFVKGSFKEMNKEAEKELKR